MFLLLLLYLLQLHLIFDIDIDIKTAAALALGLLQAGTVLLSIVIKRLHDHTTLLIDRATQRDFS